MKENGTKDFRGPLSAVVCIGVSFHQKARGLSFSNDASQMRGGGDHYF